MHLYIVRHGHCVAQYESATNDPDSCLSALGRKQAWLTGKRLSGSRITSIISSPLVRSLETAAIIAETMGGMGVSVWLETRELWVGQYRGCNKEDLLRVCPSASIPAKVTSDGWVHENDTYDSMLERCGCALRRLTNEFEPHDKVLIVTHGGFANYLIHTALELRPSAPVWFEMENCAITRLRFRSSEERLSFPPLYPAIETEMLSLNDVAHLSTPSVESTE